MISFILYKLGSALSRHLPFRLVYFIATVIANLNFLVNHRSRRAVIANLTRMRDAYVKDSGPLSQPLSRVARQVFHNFAFNIVDFLRLPELDLHALQRVVEVEGWENIEQAQQRGRGIIALSAHLGNWEWGGAFFSLNGCRVKVVALDHGVGRVTRFFSERRRAKGVDVLPLIGSTFAMLEWLRGGGMVGLMADRDYAHQGMPVRFFGQTAMMPRAHASLALKTGASILPCFVLRRPGGRCRLVIRPPVTSEDLPSFPPGERVRILVERCLAIFEEMIRYHPDQWCVFEPLWQETSISEREAGARPRAAAPPATTRSGDEG